MKLVRIRDVTTARIVSQGVRRFNGVSLSTNRIMTRPHFAIKSGGQTAGWIGYEGRGSGVYELAHLSVRPRYRRCGLAQRAVSVVLNKVRASGGHYTYVRINHRNIPSMCLALKMGFRKTGRGKVCVFGRKV